jgi:hypothetical protein
MSLRARTFGVAAMSVVSIALATSSCADTDVAGRLLAVDAEGIVAGLVYLDRNGDEVLGGTDEGVEGLEVRLYIAGTQSVAATATTDEDGVFIIRDVPVGRLRMEADADFFGDSLVVFDSIDADFTLESTDTLEVFLGVTFPAFTLAEARDLAVGTKGFTRGIVLNPRFPFGDASVHLQDGDTYLRVIGTPRADLFPGDSVRVLGRIALDAGQVVLREAEPFLLAQQVIIPEPLELSTALAASAEGGERDAALVRIRDADILDTVTVTSAVGRDLYMTVDDGSGPLEMVLPELLGFDLGQVQPDSFSVRAATGLLVPTRAATGEVTWRLVPRVTGDLVIDPIPFPGQVTDLTPVDRTSSSLTLNWTEVDDGFGAPSSYEARYRPVTTLAWTDVSAGDCAAPIAGSAIGEVLSCTLEGLEPESTYFMQVRSFRGTVGVDEQYGPWSNITGAETEPLPLPGQVTDLTVVAATSTTLTVDWTEVDDGFGAPSDYTARFRPNTTLAWTVITVGDCASPIAGSAIDEVLTCTVEGLVAGSTYFVQVRPFRGTLGVDEQFGPWSNSAGGTTPP